MLEIKFPNDLTIKNGSVIKLRRNENPHTVIINEGIGTIELIDNVTKSGGTIGQREKEDAWSWGAKLNQIEAVISF